MATNKFNSNLYTFTIIPIDQTINDLLQDLFPLNPPIGLRTLDVRRLEVIPSSSTQHILIRSMGEDSGCIPAGDAIQLKQGEKFVIENTIDMAYDLKSAIAFSTSNEQQAYFILTF